MLKQLSRARLIWLIAIVLVVAFVIYRCSAGGEDTPDYQTTVVEKSRYEILANSFNPKDIAMEGGKALFRKNCLVSNNHFSTSQMFYHIPDSLVFILYTFKMLIYLIAI